jgi:hypothetical protein
MSARGRLEELCGGTMHKGQWFQCGRVVLTRDPNR